MTASRGYDMAATSLRLALVALCASCAALAQTPTVSYRVRVDSGATDHIDVVMTVHGAPKTIRVAMKVHPEYNAAYWRTIEMLGVSGGDGTGRVSRTDSTLWKVTFPAAGGELRYRLHVPAAPATRRAWQTAV